MTSVPTVTLNNGVQIPQLGFGTWQVSSADAEKLVAHALEAGYRHIDTAQMYGNEEGVGAAIAASGIDRSEIFVTSKLNNNKHDPAAAVASFDESLAKLGLEQLDLFLIHWPLPTTDLDFVDTWRALEQLYADGKVRAIGVSNFQANHLRRLKTEATVVPAVNQIEVHPYFAQEELRGVNAELGIATEAWSPLAQGEVFADQALSALAEKLGRPVSQLVLRWHLDRGDIVFPKASSPERIAENFDLFDFDLDEADLASISALDSGRRIGPDPDTFDWIPA